MNKTKIIISSHGFLNWGGGIDFIRYIASSITTLQTCDLLTHKIFIPKLDTSEILFHSFRTVVNSIRGRSEFSLKDTLFINSKMIAHFSDFDSVLDVIQVPTTFHGQLEAAKRFPDHVLLPCMSPIPSGIGISWIGYLYDFQHLHIPYFFSEKIIAHRNNLFREMLTTAEHIVVNSRSVRNDAYNFCEQSTSTVHVLPFSPCPKPEWLPFDESIINYYNINQPFFIISNQFWIHKDHKTAILAFSEFYKDFPEFLLICTGDTTDFRFPNYFTEIKDLIRQLKLDKQVRILGHIPKRHQIELLKMASAVIQPTLFEGGPGGGSGYDAIAYGTRLILSDIPVNREITDELASFFKVGDYHDLYLKMKYICGTSHDREIPSTLIAKGIERKIVCGNKILDIANQASFSKRN